MAFLLAFAFLSGVVTILSPCILPVLPIVLSGGMGRGKARPFGVIAGFVLSFTTFTLALTAIVQALGIPADAMRYFAAALIFLFGLVMLLPALGALFEAAASRASGAFGARRGKTGGERKGFWSGLTAGLGLGLVWTPCVGPIMASVISLALTKRIDGGSVLITLAYSLGTAIPMLAIMVGGRSLLARVPALAKRSAGIQRGFGALMMVLALAIALGWDRKLQSAILTAFPSYGSGLTAIEKAAPVRNALAARALRGIASGVGPGAGPGAAAGVFAGAPADASSEGVLGDYGAAPDFVATGTWLNSPGRLDLASLRGKVVLVDFWTYSCVNCVRTIPYLRAWYEAYKDKGLVIVGVHSPEFEFEKVTANVTGAMRDLGVSWPVVQDNDYAQWNAYANQYWPAHYFIDARGRVRYYHFGEGGYEASEAAIRTLLEEAGSKVSALVSKPAPALADETPETYLGYERGAGLVSSVTPAADKPVDYAPGQKLGIGQWNLEGRWTIAGQYIVPEGEGTLSYHFKAKSVYLVVEPQAPGGSISASVDGKPAPDTGDLRAGLVRPSASRLYQLVGLPTGGEHLLKLVVKGKLRLFAFTFG